MRLAALFSLAILTAAVAAAHPGSAIAVSKGIVYFVDTGGGVFSIDASGRIVRREGPGFHWFALDPESRFLKTAWPYMPGAEFQSAGTHPTVILSSDYPVTIADGKFIYPQPSGDRVQLLAMEPSGAKSVRATLPPIRRGAETIPWINGIAPGPDHSLIYAEDRAIRKVDAQGRVSNIAVNVAVPNCTAIPGSEVETAPYLRGLAVAADGSIYVAAAGCGAVLKIDAKGSVTTVLRTSAPWSPTAVAVSGRDVYVLEYLHTASDNRREWLPRVRKISASGQVTMLGGNTR